MPPPTIVSAARVAELQRQIPLFTGDEPGYPEAAKALKDLFLAADGLIICSPEYNGSVCEPTHEFR